MTFSVVLSPTPLSPGRRKELLERLGGETDFIEISELRRRGLAGATRALRSKSADSAIATGSREEMRLFDQLLRLVLLLVPARLREIESPDRDRTQVKWRNLPGLLLALSAASGKAALSLTRNALAAHRSQAPGAALRRSPTMSRCLYLRPTLQFGAPVGGSIAHVAGVVNALSSRGVEVHLLSSGEQPLVEPTARASVVEPRFHPAYPAELNSHRYHEQFYRAALEKLESVRPDFLYQRYSLNDLTGVRLRHRFGTPLVLEFNGSEVWVQKHWGRRLRFEKVSGMIEERNLRSADLVVAISEPIAQQALQAGASPERVLFYPNCVDPSLFDPGKFSSDSRRLVRERLGVPLNADLFAFLGTFGKWHGVDVLASAVRSLLETSREWLVRRRVHFLVVGDGIVGPRVRELLQPAVAAGFATLTGLRPQEEAPAILAASDVLVSPHIPNEDGTPFFGSPTKLFEYMAMGKLLVASDLDQIGQVLRGWAPGKASTPDGEAAILVPPGDLAGLIEGIRRAAEMPEDRRRELGGRARSYVLRSLTWEKHVDAVVAGLERVLSLDPVARNDSEA